MNEPILPGKKPASEWLTGELGGKYFVQRLSLNLNGRTRQQLANDWATKLVGAIRSHDDQHMITVGVIPWVFAFGGGKPLFYSQPVAQQFDFASVHFYPQKGQVATALQALKGLRYWKAVSRRRNVST